MMVADDHVETGIGRFLERFEGLCAAVDGDREIGPAPLQLDQRRAGRTITLHQPVGDVDHWVGAEAT